MAELTPPISPQPQQQQQQTTTSPESPPPTSETSLDSFPLSSFWKCAVCTYDNVKRSFKCAMCNASKGTSTRYKATIKTDTKQVTQAQTAALNRLSKSGRKSARKNKRKSAGRGKTQDEEDDEQEQQHKVKLGRPTNAERKRRMSLVNAMTPSSTVPSNVPTSQISPSSLPHPPSPPILKYMFPRHPNVDRSQVVVTEVTVRDITVVINEFPLKRHIGTQS